MANVIETHRLSKTYEMGDVTVHALKDVDFTVEAGCFLAIMGPSGSGKSTLMHLLGGLDAPTSGDVSLDGRRYSTMSDDQLTITRRRKIGFIFQFFNLLPTLTASENVALPLIVDGNAPDPSRVGELLKLVGLDGREGHKPHQLSGGQQQRVAIARALVTGPKIVLADEPTGNLDSESGAQVLALLRRACDEHGQTVVMVTHDSHAASVADRIVFLKDGQLAGDLDFQQGADQQDKTRTQEIRAVMDGLAT